MLSLFTKFESQLLVRSLKRKFKNQPYLLYLMYFVFLWKKKGRSVAKKTLPFLSKARPRFR